MPIFVRAKIYALIAVEHGSRRTHLIGISTHPTGAWTIQAARNLMTGLGDRVPVSRPSTRLATTQVVVWVRNRDA